MSNTSSQAHFYIKQDIIRGASQHDRDILVMPCHLSDAHTVLPAFFESIDSRQSIVGLAQVHQTRHVMRYLALASKTKVIVIDMLQQGNMKQWKAGFSVLQSFLKDGMVSKSAFHMDKLATSLFQDYQLRIDNAEDLFSLTPTGTRGSTETLKAIFGGRLSLNAKSLPYLLDNPCGVDTKKKCALQAWLAYYGTSKMENSLPSRPSIKTSMLDQLTLSFISTTIRVTNCVEALKPTRIKHDVESKIGMKSKQKLSFQAQRYKTKFRNAGGPQHIEVKISAPDGKMHVQRGKLAKVDGRQATVIMNGPLNGRVEVVQTVGKEPPTSAETLKAAIMLEALRDPTYFTTHPFIKSMWFPKQAISWNKTQKIKKPSTLYFPSDRSLNKSQNSAVRTILSSKDEHRVVVVHGPPGTGKTTVIAASVTSIMRPPNNQSETIWLAAQSNVAVKNIAEKLVAVNFLDFILIVSHEFHFDWHEHLYEKISARIVRSDGFPENLVDAERALQGSKVILCTVSMLSNDKIAPFTTLVPIQTVIFDEASQIDMTDYLPALVRFQSSVRKLVFIGDHKQLAPYGSSDVPMVKSVFEHPHLRKKAVFLDTQYRMPVPIGDFISKQVYDGLLKTEHKVQDRSCCRFVNVSNGVEENQGHSWKNLREVDAAIRIAKQLNAQGKSFRIITPYDPQRSLLENGIKQANLPWENKCFNVDSFQGNEDDYIIVSVVRTKKLGFLNDKRRVNVMLTRCKKAMIICTNKAFIEGPGADSLVGGLRQSLKQDNPWINYREILRPGFILSI